MEIIISMTAHILLLSAYDAVSQNYWRQQLETELSEYRWTQLALPPRHFAWRQRGNSLSWSDEKYTQLEQSYDLLIVSSSTDISALRGFRPNLARCPLIVYFHENQFAYPESATRHNLVDIQLTSIYSAWCADWLLFNSHHNMETFLQGAQRLIKKLPDHLPKGMIDKISAKSQVLPIGINQAESPLKPLNYQAGTPLNILWNHRWEYDKNPAVFFAAIEQLIEYSIPFKMNIVGQQFRHSPAIFNQAEKQFAPYINHWGFQDRSCYLSLLQHCNLVVSTALHEFQGVAMQEAIASGCLPVTPDRLAYREYIPADLRYRSKNKNNEPSALAELILKIYRSGYPAINNPIADYSWSKIGKAYRTLIKRLTE